MGKFEVSLPFARVIDFGGEVRPGAIPVLDFTTRALTDDEVAGHRFAIGRYHEKRPFSYGQPLFEGARDIHMGIDLFAPVGTPVHAFAEGKILACGYNEAPGDYGYTIVTEHFLADLPLYALHGHLGRRSLEGKTPGQRVAQGEVIAWVGDRQENGGWVPHLHFQLSYVRPASHDLPGVVSREQLPLALLKYPDPRLVLGALY